MNKVVSGDLLIKGVLIELEVGESDTDQDRIIEAIKAYLAHENIEFSEISTVDLNLMDGQVHKANAIDWAVKNNSLVFKKDLLGFNDKILDIQGTIRAYEKRKVGKRSDD